MKNLQKMMQEAQKMQARMSEMQESLAHAQVTGNAGAGMVQVIMNGKGEVQKVTIDPAVGADLEIIEDLMVAACADAKSKAEELAKEKMSELTGGLSLPPGFSLPF